MPDEILVSIGDDAILNVGSVIQCHSLEDGTFNSDYTTIGAGTTLGVHAFVHDGVTMGDGSVLDADAFLMKGKEVAPHGHWAGNPAGACVPTRMHPHAEGALGSASPAAPGDTDLAWRDVGSLSSPA